MKIFNTLLISFLVAFSLLFWAGNALAAACVSSCTNTAANCDCAGATVSAAGRYYCFENQLFDTQINANAQANCKAAAAALSQPPENFSLPEAPLVSGQALLNKINTITNWVFAIFLAISIIYIVLAAFQFVTGGGKPEEINSARQKLIYAAIGIAIALLAKGIPIVIRNIVVSP